MERTINCEAHFFANTFSVILLHRGSGDNVVVMMMVIVVVVHLTTLLTAEVIHHPNLIEREMVDEFFPGVLSQRQCSCTCHKSIDP